MKNTKLMKELFYDWKRFEVGYISILLLTQIVVYIIAPDSVIGMLSGTVGVVCMVYGMKGRKVSFVFGTIQCLAMTYIAWKSRAYGSFLMDIFYVISQPIGYFMWGQNDAVRQFSIRGKIAIAVTAFVAWLSGWGILYKIGGRLPYFDSVNFVISFIAQVLYILKFKENWSLWILVDIANVTYWLILTLQFITGNITSGNDSLGQYLSQTALQAALLFNAIYAVKVWETMSKKTNKN